MEGQEYETLFSVSQLISTLRENSAEIFVLEFDGEFFYEEVLDQPLKLLREKLRSNLDKYFFEFHETTRVAALIDPRYKSLLFLNEYERKTAQDRAKEIFKKLDSSFGRNR